MDNKSDSIVSQSCFAETTLLYTDDKRDWLPNTKEHCESHVKAFQRLGPAFLFFADI